MNECRELFGRESTDDDGEKLRQRQETMDPESLLFLLLRCRPPRQELPDQMMEASDSPCSTNVKFGVSEAG